MAVRKNNAVVTAALNIIPHGKVEAVLSQTGGTFREQREYSTNLPTREELTGAIPQLQHFAPKELPRGYFSDRGSTSSFYRAGLRDETCPSHPTTRNLSCPTHLCEQCDIADGATWQKTMRRIRPKIFPFSWQREGKDIDRKT